MASERRDHTGKSHLVGNNILGEHAAEHGHGAPHVSRASERRHEGGVRDGVPVHTWHLLEQALRAVEMARTSQRGEDAVARGGVAERRGCFVEQLEGAGEGGWEAGVEGEDRVANEGVGGEEARLGSERVQLLAAAEARRTLEGRDEEWGQRIAATQHGRRLAFLCFVPFSPLRLPSD
jgi:hypothetical protein